MPRPTLRKSQFRRASPQLVVATEHAHGAIALAPPDVLHVGVGDPVGKHADEPDVVHALVGEVAWIEVEAKAPVAPDGLDRPLAGGDVERNFGGMDLQREIDVGLFESVQDRQETPAKIGKAPVPYAWMSRKGVGGFRSTSR